MIDPTREKAIGIVGASQLCALNADGLAVVEAYELLRLTERVGMLEAQCLLFRVVDVEERVDALEEWRIQQTPTAPREVSAVSQGEPQRPEDTAAFDEADIYEVDSPTRQWTIGEIREHVAAGAREKLAAGLASEIEAMKRERDELVAQAAVITYERDDLAGQLRALRTDHELLIEAHGKSCGLRAQLVSELEAAKQEAGPTTDTVRLLDVVRAAQRIRRVLAMLPRNPAEFALAAQQLGETIDAYERDPGGYER